MKDTAQSPALPPASHDGETADFAAFQKKVEGTNINGQTLLATDYLNHFNEVVMLLEMISDMPELLDEAKAWAPKSYQDHFRACAFSDAELAVEAYDHVPERYRRPFEQTIDQLNRLIVAGVGRLDAAVKDGNPEALREMATATARIIQKVQGVASGIIHGRETPMDQSEIDWLLDV